jgi:hypothetical protein
MLLGVLIVVVMELSGVVSWLLQMTGRCPSLVAPHPSLFCAPVVRFY